MTDQTTPVILAAVRTPVGRYLGGLSSLAAPQLGAIVIREALARAGVPAAEVQEVFMGQVLQGGSGQAPARQAMIHAGVPGTASAVTINEVCGSGLRAVMLAAAQIRAGERDVVVAGGQESMSTAPHYLFGMRQGIKAGDQLLKDGVIHDGLWDSFGNNHMGEYAEYTATKAGITRAEQDAFSLESHRRAVAATEAGQFTREIVPVEVKAGKGTTVIAADESPRKDTSLEALARLKPVFRPDGTVTAGNAPGLNDGAAAVVVTSLAWARAHGLTPRARITATATAGGEPRELFFAPIYAVQALMKKEGKTIGDYDRYESNEAFAAVALADGRGLGWDWAKANPRGGAVAIGHPIGASGARLLTTLLHTLEDDDQHAGFATLCLGGGNAVALGVERI